MKRGNPWFRSAYPWLGLCVVLAPQLGCRARGGASQAPSYAQARAIVDSHCVACHSGQPTVPAFPIAPAGVELDTAAQMRQYAERIRARTVLDKTMPLLNKTGMTDREREVLDLWVENGAREL